MTSPDFWSKLRRLVVECEVVIDRPKGSEHPRIPGIRYPHDYGYLKDTTASDGAELDVWVGSGDRGTLSGIVCTVDLRNRDVELKLLLGCTDEERETIFAFHNEGTQGGLLLEPWT